MARKNALTMEEIQAGLSEAHSKEERFDFLMSLTVKQLKEFAKHQDYSGVMSYMKKTDIAEYIIDSYYNSIAWELAECKSYDEVVKFAIRRHVANDEFRYIAHYAFDWWSITNYLGKPFDEMACEYSRNRNLEMGEAMQETPEQPEIGTKQPELNEISEGQPVDREAENRTVEKVLALYVPPKQSVKNIHRLSKALIAEQRLEKWKVKHAVFWARGMPDKTKRKFLKRLEEFL